MTTERQRDCKAAPAAAADDDDDESDHDDTEHWIRSGFPSASHNHTIVNIRLVIMYATTRVFLHLNTIHRLSAG